MAIVTHSYQLQHVEFGGSGPAVVFLHANGFNAQCYKPLAEHLKGRFRCIGIDLPGHGLSKHCLPEPFTRAALAAELVGKLQELQLAPCYVLGHSLGGSLALLAEILQPGLFAAIYSFEPVVAVAEGPSRPANDQIVPNIAEQEYVRLSASETNQTDGLVPLANHAGSSVDMQHSKRQWNSPLAQLAAKRRRWFPSRQAALDTLSRKPPFSALHPDCLRQYIQHGLEPAVSEEVASTQARCQSGNSSHCSSQEGYRLVCKPEVEALIFETWTPLPVLEYSYVHCRVRVASGADTSGMHQLLFKAADAVAAALSQGERVVFCKLSHLGPLEDPVGVASDAAAFFSTVPAAFESMPATAPWKPVQSRL